MMPLDDVSQLKLAERIKQAVRRMRTRAWRYPVVLVVAPDLPEMGVAFWQSVARGCQLPCVDLLERAAADAEVQEHAYIWSVFVEWLGRRPAVWGEPSSWRPTCSPPLGRNESALISSTNYCAWSCKTR